MPDDIDTLFSEPTILCRFSIASFMASKHDYELTADSYWHVHLDHKHIGSGGDDSWSPSVLEVDFWMIAPQTYDCVACRKLIAVHITSFAGVSAIWRSCFVCIEDGRSTLSAGNSSLVLAFAGFASVACRQSISICSTPKEGHQCFQGKPVRPTLKLKRISSAKPLEQRPSTCRHTQ